MSNIYRQFSCYPNKGRESQDFPALRNSCAQKRHVIWGIKLIPPPPWRVSRSQPLDEGPVPPSVSHRAAGATGSLSLGGPRAPPGTLLSPRDLPGNQKGIWRDRYWGPISSHCTWSGICAHEQKYPKYEHQQPTGFTATWATHRVCLFTISSGVCLK